MNTMSLPDLLVKNGTVLTLDPENTIIENGFIAVQGDGIAELGSLDQAPPQARKTIDARGGLILPGLINGHTHAAMTLFRGLADDLPLMDWLNHYIFPVENRMDAEFVRTGSLLACAEMIMSGTTTFCDMYLFADEVAAAAREAGMRGVVGEVLYDFPSPNYGTIENGFAYTESLIEKWHADPLVSVAVEPHSPYTCSPELLTRAADMARAHEALLILHVAETLTEVETVKNAHGLRPVEFLHSLGLLDPRLIADHCIHLSEKEMDLMAQHGVKVIFNPESNMKLASGIAPVAALQSRGVTVGLGTDGCASNNDLDLFSEMDTAAKLPKVSTLDPTVMSAERVLKMATLQNARALGLHNQIGSLEVGKKADVIVLDTDKPHLTPMYNPFSHLVYAARGSDVCHTIINGRVVMEDRRLTTLDLEKVMDRAVSLSHQVKNWLKLV
jgi:5-methylthioadenosine/S-adenosylhomocysteine deaminase